VTKQIQCRSMRNLTARNHERLKRFQGVQEFMESGQERECLVLVAPSGPLNVSWDSRISLEGIVVPFAFLFEFYM
jgi:hypothetical protein